MPQYFDWRTPDVPLVGCKRKEDLPAIAEHLSSPKKPRLVFTDLQRRTLQAIFKVIIISNRSHRVRWKHFKLSIFFYHHEKRKQNDHQKRCKLPSPDNLVWNRRPLEISSWMPGDDPWINGRMKPTERMVTKSVFLLVEVNRNRNNIEFYSNQVDTIIRLIFAKMMKWIWNWIKTQTISIWTIRPTSTRTRTCCDIQNSQHPIH